MSKQQYFSKIATQLSELEKSISSCQETNTTISKTGVGWHIDHTLKVINRTHGVLKDSSPADYKWHFNYIRSLIFLLRYIPRGNVKAPKVVTPEGAVEKEDLIKQLDIAKNNLVEFESFPGNSNFKHPYFGMLNLKRSVNFLVLHTEHHLKIVREILAASK